jgi:predicted RNase H-like HicB family nuclease
MHYSIEIFYSGEDGGWIAVVPDLPGCSAFGESRYEAAVEIETAIAAWLECASKSGITVPLPTMAPEGYKPATWPQ